MTAVATTVASMLTSWAQAWRIAGLLALAGVLSSCVSAPGIGKPVSWSALPGWQQGQQAQAWPALQQNCERLATRAASFV